MAELVGGPFDGASGPLPVFAEILWFRADPARRGRNGLICSLDPRPSAVKYSHEGDGRYVYGDLMDAPSGRVLQAVA